MGVPSGFQHAMALRKAAALKATWKHRESWCDRDPPDGVDADAWAAVSGMYRDAAQVTALKAVKDGLKALRTNTSNLFLCSPAEVVLAVRKAGADVDPVALKAAFAAIGREQDHVPGVQDVHVIREGVIRLDVRNPITDGVARMLGSNGGELERVDERSAGMWKMSDLRAGDNVVVITTSRRKSSYTFEVPELGMRLWIVELTETPEMGPGREMVKMRGWFYGNGGRSIRDPLDARLVKDTIYVHPDAVAWVLESGTLTELGEDTVRSIVEYLRG